MNIAWRNFHRGILWLLAAALVLWGFDNLGPWLGLSQYSVRKLGALATIAASVWGGYRVSRDVCKIDPSGAGTPTAAAIQHLARAVLLAGFAFAACVSV
ncbi:MAG TPA: hypothetical protein VFG73_02175 [Rhodanobacteraceae bacterium]|nr:hypothetical protein [Rhodanobacteraceae bacterium]